jgi:hypothetical protein
VIELQNVKDPLFTRLRRTVSASSVLRSLPVLFFGDLLTARAATVGLNPSDQEYLSKDGIEVDGAKRRFETLTSLGAPDRASLTDEQCASAIQTMRKYYERERPVYSWFRSLNRVIGAMGFSYEKGEVAHLDLVQESTKPTWSSLSKEELEQLRLLDMPFLSWQLKSFSLEIIVCNGKTPSVDVCSDVNVRITNEGTLKLLKWWTATAVVDSREIRLAGWNKPLQRPTGLGADGEIELGKTLAASLGLA